MNFELSIFCLVWSIDSFWLASEQTLLHHVCVALLCLFCGPRHFYLTKAVDYPSIQKFLVWFVLVIAHFFKADWVQSICFKVKRWLIAWYSSNFFKAETPSLDVFFLRENPKVTQYVVMGGIYAVLRQSQGQYLSFRNLGQTCLHFEYYTLSSSCLLD